VTDGFFAGQAKGGRLEAAAALVGVAFTGLVEKLAGLGEVVVMGDGEAVEVVVGDAVVAGIVVSAEEYGFARNAEAFLGQALAHRGIIGHLGKGAGVGPAATAAACAAIMRRLVGIVQTGGAVADDEDEPGKAGGQADIAKQALGNVGHFFHRVASLSGTRTGIRLGTVQQELGKKGGLDEAAGRLPDAGGEARE
jgi:hypothetical protein